MKELNANSWNQRYLEENTPWDIGTAAPALVHFLKSLDKDCRILIPGAGKSHEAIYLHQQGFTAVYVCDWAEQAFDHLKTQCPDFPKDHLLVADFFDLSIEVDLLLEQTFFCAIDPALRKAYMEKAHQLLAKEGRLAGLFWAQPFPFDGPPFGGTQEEYLTYFPGIFEVLQLAISPDSIGPRKDRELFIELKKVEK